MSFAGKMDVWPSYSSAPFVGVEQSMVVVLHPMETIVAVLSVTQLFLIVFTFGVAREVFVLRAQRQTEEAWPLMTLSPGDLLPDALHRAALASLSPGRPGVLILCAITNEGLRQLLMSLIIISRNWRSRLIFVSESEDIVSTCNDLLTNIEGNVHVIPSLARTVGLLSNAILFAQNGRVVDASALVRTPSSIRNRFSFVAN